MKCLHPHIHEYCDPVSGEVVRIVIPCGKCIACLHNQQDSWTIRLLETAKHSSCIIYDTLTVRPASMPVVDVCEEVFSPLRKFSEESWSLLKKYDFKLPCIDRGMIRDWIKRGRENYYNDHGNRLKMKLFAVEEYGPQTSRPHVHLLMFGVSYADYITYFAKPWRKDMGFTKTKLISGKNKTMKDRQCVTRYVSKYVSKGVFESPLVKDGFLPRPFRCISHGIGAEYLDDKKFDAFRSTVYNFWKNLTPPDDTGEDFRICAKFGTVPLVYQSDEHLSFALGLYYDSQGFPHALPRYYKHKVLGLDAPNLFSYVVQKRLRGKQAKDLEERYYNTAVALGLDVSSWDMKAPYYGLHAWEYPTLVEHTILQERENARIAAKNRFTMLKNHYKRILTNPQLSLYY